VSGDPLDALLARSRAPGRFVERRSFTLSREKAIAKQREFALRHPRQYLLELVQGAVFAGAPYMAIDTRPESLLVAWVGGQSFQGRELENLFDYLFADRGQRQWRHLVQLAIGVNALIQRQPRVLRIESGDGKKAFRMDLDPSGRATIGQPTEPIQGTYLFAEYTVGWLSRFTSSGVSEEQQLVEERCLYTPIPILLNGMAPFGYRGSRHIAVFGARAWEPFDHDGRRGVVAIHASPDGPRGFRMVVGGVWISTLPLEQMADVPLYGVICDDNLRKTADQSDIVQDRRFAEMLHAVQPVATRLMHRVRGPGYAPPVLAPLPPPEAEQVPARKEPEIERVEAEPLPDSIPMLPPRNPTGLAALRERLDAPVFTVVPSVAETLAGQVAAPDRFPWKILLLTEGQSLTLQSAIPELTVHRLTSKADVDFVRRVVGRRIRTREVAVPVGDSRVVLQLFLDGPLPDWGPGIPFCVVGPNGVIEYGGISGHDVRVSGTRVGSRDRVLALAPSLPSVALTVHGPAGTLLHEGHVRAALDGAWQLAAQPDGETHGPLLAHLLGAMGVPQLVHAPGSREGTDQIGTEVSLPLGWPLTLRAAPLCPTASGAPLTLASIEELLGSPRSVQLLDLSDLLALDPLERRLGYGHLTHPELEVRPLFGAGRFGQRWVWIERADFWGSPALEQVVWVSATFAPRDRDQQFTGGIRPYPELVGASKGPVDEGHESWVEGFRALFAGLQRVEAEQRWGTFASGSVTEGRAEGMGRLALIHLAMWLQQDHVPLLVPSDGGGRRSPREIREHPAARVVARRGVRLAEPWTFALTRDELEAVAGSGGLCPPDAAAETRMPRLRYDDTPAVWRTLSETDQGWLVRQEVHQAGLRGWLGLRCPYDGTAGVLLRTTGELVGQSDLERSVPCHGLLWSDDGAPTLSSEQRRVAQLAGLRLYQALVPILDQPASDAHAEDARAYSLPYVLLAWRRGGQLQGTALELARRIDLRRDGQRVTSLDAWLTAAPPLRPAIDDFDPKEIETPDEPPPSTDEIYSSEAAAEAVRPLEVRVLDALSTDRLTLRITPLSDSTTRNLVWVRQESHRDRIVLAVNDTHPAVAQALLGEGRPREVLLLELLRQAVVFGNERGRGFDLCRAQQVLLAQRLSAD
jgi:hypothetical protein